jgi:hypothetical protein
MLQTNYTGTIFDFTVFKPSCDDKPSCDEGTSSTPAEPQSVKAPCEVTERLVDLFAEITGWTVEFDESEASLQRRKMLVQDGPAEGTFSIADMCARWPAKKPTGHRAKCDELVELIDQLVGDLQTARVDLGRARSALAALDPSTDVADDELLIDSFAPKFEHRRRWNDVTEPADSHDDSRDSTCEQTDENDFEVHQEIDASISNSSIGLVQPPFAGWNLAGETGIADDTYLDWLVDSDERISIMAGRIESDLGVGDTQATLVVDPLTSEYLLEGPTDFQAFYLWCSDSKSLCLMEPSQQWKVLHPGQAIVGTTSANFIANDRWASQVAELADDSADELALMLSESLGESERLLVLQRN